jgi:hypothetical protein
MACAYNQIPEQRFGEASQGEIGDQITFPAATGRAAILGSSPMCEVRLVSASDAILHRMELPIERLLVLGLERCAACEYTSALIPAWSDVAWAVPLLSRADGRKRMRKKVMFS